MNCKPHAIYTLVLSIVFGTVSAQSAESQSEKPRVASRDLVRECMDAEDTLLTRKLNIDEHKKEDQLALAGAEASQATLTEMQSRLNTADTAAVDAFNKQRSAQNEAGAALNARIDAHSKEIDAYNADSKAYNDKCAAVKMRVHDRRKVMRERAAEAKAEGAATTK